MVEAFSIPFITILLAEFLDKSQLSVLLLATKTKKHTALLLGVLGAFIIVDGSAIFFGAFLTQVIPATWLRMISGLLFIGFGLLSLRSAADDEKHHAKLTHPLLSGFTVVFLSEWGDKTQLASAVFATQFDPLFVFFGVITALFLLSMLAVLLSQQLLRSVKQQTVHKVAALLFILLGVIFLLLP